MITRISRHDIEIQQLLDFLRGIKFIDCSSRIVNFVWKKKKKKKEEKFETIWIREFGFVRKDENGHGCLILFFIETIVATSWMDIWSHKFRRPTLNPVKEMNIEERKDGELMVTNGWVCAQLRFYWKAGEKSGQILGGTRLERGNYRRKDELVSRDLRASNVEIFFKPCFF